MTMSSLWSHSNNWSCESGCLNKTGRIKTVPMSLYVNRKVRKSEDEIIVKTVSRLHE
jgi:hypothetical protein